MFTYIVAICLCVWHHLEGYDKFIISALAEDINNLVKIFMILLGQRKTRIVETKNN